MKDGKKMEPVYEAAPMLISLYPLATMFRRIALLPPPQIDGMPPGAEVRHARLQNALARGGLKAVATPGRGEGYFNIGLHPKDATGFSTYKTGLFKEGEPYTGRTSYYDPKKAVLVPDDIGEGYVRHFVKPKAHVALEIKPLSGQGYMYRGMSDEEFLSFNRTGEIKSLGSYNIGDGQKGLTYWSTSARTATSYANSFAPSEHRASIAHPGYVVAARMPKPVDIVKVRGTGEDEIGVNRAIKKSEVVAAWRGTVFDYDPGVLTLKREGYEGSTYVDGGGVAASSQLDWQKVAV